MPESKMTMIDYRSEEFRQKVRSFEKDNPVKEISAARMIYSLYVYGRKIPETAQQILDSSNGIQAKDKRQKKKIQNINSTASLEQWMSRPIFSYTNKQLFYDKLLARENEMDTRIKRKCLYNTESIYTENAVYFFLYEKQNPCPWIRAELNNVKDQYMRCLLCLVIGCRGDVSDIVPMMDEYKRYVEKCPNDDYDQGPLIAVSELSVRFLNDHPAEPLPLL